MMSMTHTYSYLHTLKYDKFVNITVGVRYTNSTYMSIYNFLQYTQYTHVVNRINLRKQAY